MVSFTENNETEEESLRVTIISEKDSKKSTRKSKPQITVSSLKKPQTGYGQSMIETNGADTLGYDEQSHRRAISNQYGSQQNLNFGIESKRAAETTPKFDYTKHSLMQMDDVDFDELLECAEENIESSAFFASSMQLLGIIDSTIGAIDDRLAKKRASIMPPSASNNRLTQFGLHAPKQQNFVSVMQN